MLIELVKKRLHNRPIEYRFNDEIVKLVKKAIYLI